MMQKADIVKADVTHIKRIAEIEKGCIPDGWSEKAFSDALENPNSLIFAAILDEEVIGFLNGSYILDEGELLNIAVSDEYRRTGTAGILLKKFETELFRLGVRTVYLEVREGNTPARMLYEKNGYIKTGLRKNYYRSPTENAVLMCKELL